MPLSKPQKQIFDDTSRFRVVSAGRRFGKSFLSIWEMARAARFPDQKVMYVAPSYRQAKSIIWDELKSQLISKRWVKKINESELSINLVNGSSITLRSADAGDSIRGISCDFVVLDECAFFVNDNRVWTDIIRPTLSDRGGSALFISTPQGMGNWFYDLYQQGHTMEGWSSHQYTTAEGGNVPEEEILQAKRDLDTKTYLQEYEASFQSSGNVIYYAFKPENIRKFDSEIPNQIHVGLDFNVSKMAAIVAVKYTDGLHIFDEIVLRNTNTDEICQAIRERYPNKKVFLYADPAGNQRRTSARDNTDHLIVKQWGMELRAPKSHPLVKDRINAANRLMCNAEGTRHLFVDPGCKHTVTAISKHEYKPGTSIPIKDAENGYDGVNDSWGYMVSFLYPLRKEYTQRTAKVFGAF
jgi:hypothetical protein